MPSMLRPRPLLSLGLPLLLFGCDAGKEPPASAQTDPAPVATSDQAPGDEGGTSGGAPTDAEGKGEVASDAAPTPTDKSGTSGDAESEADTAADADADADTAGAPAPDDAEPGPAEGAAVAEDRPETDDPRDPVLVPEGTPEANRKAFLALPIAKGDKRPVGGIGPGGIHLDELVIGKGWVQSRCETATGEFTAGIDDKVSLCVRVVHPRGTEEELTVKWIKEGKGPKRSKLTVKPIHAYLTRVWLPVKNWSKGSWTVVVEASDGTELGKGSFTVE